MGNPRVAWLYQRIKCGLRWLHRPRCADAFTDISPPHYRQVTHTRTRTNSTPLSKPTEIRICALQSIYPFTGAGAEPVSEHYTVYRTVYRIVCHAFLAAPFKKYIRSSNLKTVVDYQLIFLVISCLPILSFVQQKVFKLVETLKPAEQCLRQKYRINTKLVSKFNNKFEKILEKGANS